MQDPAAAAVGGEQQISSLDYISLGNELPFELVPYGDEEDASDEQQQQGSSTANCSSSSTAAEESKKRKAHSVPSSKSVFVFKWKSR